MAVSFSFGAGICVVLFRSGLLYADGFLHRE